MKEGARLTLALRKSISSDCEENEEAKSKIF